MMADDPEATYDQGHPDYDPTEGGQILPPGTPVLQGEVFGGTVWAPDGEIVYDYLRDEDVPPKAPRPLRRGRPNRRARR